MTSVISAPADRMRSYPQEDADPGDTASSAASSRPVEHQFVDVVEAERRRLGREFHDGLGQRLTSLALSAAILSQKLEMANRPEAADARKLVWQIDETVREARSLVRGLYPAGLEQNGLETTLSKMLSRVEEVSRRATHMLISETWEPITNRDQAIHIFRIVQEAVNNALKHSEGTEIIVRLEQTEEQCRIEISDDGKGISDKETTGFGLRLMRSRAELLGGRIRIGSRPGQGTIVELALNRADVCH